jgi:hypothetical protein
MMCFSHWYRDSVGIRKPLMLPYHSQTLAWTEVPSHALLPFSIRAASSLTKTILDDVGYVCEVRSSRSKHCAFKQVFEDTIPVILRYRTNVALWRCLAVRSWIHPGSPYLPKFAENTISPTCISIFICTTLLEQPTLLLTRVRTSERPSLLPKSFVTSRWYEDCFDIRKSSIPPPPPPKPKP